MIASVKIVPLLLEACPTFRSDWDAHLQEWAPEAPGHYLDAAVIAAFLVARNAQGDTRTVSIGFEVLEQVLLEGDDEARNVVIVGVLETVQNIAGSRGDAGAFRPYLGPATLQAWEGLNKLWDDLDKRPPR